MWEGAAFAPGCCAHIPVNSWVVAWPLWRACVSSPSPNASCTPSDWSAQFGVAYASGRRGILWMDANCLYSRSCVDSWWRNNIEWLYSSCASRLFNSWKIDAQLTTRSVLLQHSFKHTAVNWLLEGTTLCVLLHHEKNTNDQLISCELWLLEP